VLESLANLGGQEALTGLEGHTVDPHQFLGLELNPRAAAIAELVLWIGYLQWHFRTQDGMPGEPILHAFKNIEGKFDAVLKADVSLVRDALGMPVTRRGPDGSFAEVYAYDNPCQPEWPAAEFIVGNPPFIGNKRMREVLGQGYVDAVWSAHPAMVQSADFVMLWWDHAATLLSRPTTCLRRFGLVTTNSITHVFQRRVTEQHLRNKPPISIIMAIPDHPWTKAARDTAAVRIAMTVCEAGERQGHLLQVTRESQLETDSPSLELTERSGKINSDLTIGIDSTTTVPLLSNQNMSFRGITFLGAGFVLRQSDSAYQLFVSKCEQAAIRPYLSGRDLVSRSRNVFIIDLYGLTLNDVRSQYPSIYQHLATTVKPLRDNDNREAYRINWWIFAEPRPEFREATEGLACYVAISQTAKHIAFQFVPTESLPDQTLVAIATDDAYDLGVLSSRAHRVWVLSTGATLEDRPRYSNSRCFDPFPFPSADDLQKQRIRGIAEDLDALRKVCWLSTRTSR
jgi:hypothetical protein